MVAGVAHCATGFSLCLKLPAALGGCCAYARSTMNDADLPHLVIGACMKVYEALGAGLLREAYAECVAIELRDLELDVVRGQELAFDYRGHRIRTETQLEFVVNETLLLEVRAQPEVSDLEKMQLESRLHLSGLRSALLVNFCVPTLRKGIHQITRKRKTTA
jgi:GxxExxY protein